VIVRAFRDSLGKVNVVIDLTPSFISESVEHECQLTLAKITANVAVI
jgi:hypothetical protein